MDRSVGSVESGEGHWQGGGEQRIAEKSGGLLQWAPAARRSGHRAERSWSTKFGCGMGAGWVWDGVWDGLFF